MSPLEIRTSSEAEKTVRGVCQDMARRLVSHPQGTCPVDVTRGLIALCRTQTCGKCVPCRIGLAQIESLLDNVLEGTATDADLAHIEALAENVRISADCAIGTQAAEMALTGVRAFRDDYELHTEGRCLCTSDHPVPCVQGCPANVDIPGYIALVKAGRFDDAIELICKDNPFPSACAYVCEHPCENTCRRSFVDSAVNIRGLKRYACDHETPNRPTEVAEPTGKKVAVIGGGPGGLTAAYYLTRMGHSVTVYEQRAKLGGMLRYGIPNYRLPKTLLDTEIEHITSLGVEVKLGVSVGNDIAIADLEHDFDAVYVCIGAHSDKKLRIEGEDAPGVVPAVAMLREIGDGNIADLSGQDVVVVGGGNVAMDAARSARRMGAKSVKIVYRRRRADMTALAEEIDGAIEDGCELMELVAPAHVEVNDEGHAVALWGQPQMISTVRGGRPSPKAASKPEVRIPATTIIVAIGQNIDSSAFEEFGLPCKWNEIQAQPDSSIPEKPGFFTGGDCSWGPATVIRAIEGGKVAARAIDTYLGGNHEIRCDVDIPAPNLADRVPCGRVTMKERPGAERSCDFELCEIGMSEEEMMQEAGRCLGCDHFGYGAFKGGRSRAW